MGWQNLFAGLRERQLETGNRRGGLSHQRAPRARRMQLEPLEERTLLSLTVALDKTEYMPEEPILMTVSGLTPGETVELQVLHTDGTPDTGPGHEPVLVADGGEYDCDGLTDGLLEVDVFVDPEDCVGSTFEITATTSDGETVALAFTGIEPQQVFLTTDKDDYQPGETAILVAQGFTSGETVEFLVLHSDDIPNTGAGHDPWQITDGSANDLDGLVDGNIQTTWYVNEDDSFGSVFEATATGLTSELTTAATFTDGLTQVFSDDFPPMNPPDSSKWSVGNCWVEYDYGWTGPWYPLSQPCAAGFTNTLTPLVSTGLNLSNAVSAKVTYLLQAGGHSNGPSNSDQHFDMLYMDANGTWHVVQSSYPRDFSSASLWRKYDLDFGLNSSFLWNGAKIQFRLSGANPGDTWWLDDVYVYAQMNRAPAVTATAASTGYHDDTHNHAFTWNVSDPDGNLRIVGAYLQRLDGSTWKTVRKSTATSGTLYQKPSDYTSGTETYRLKVTGTDSYNLPTTKYSSKLYIRDDDAVAPTITVEGSGGALANKAYREEVAADDQFFSWSVYDASGSSSDVTITKNGQEIFGRHYSTNLSSDTFDFNAYGVGTYVISITAEDGDADRNNDELRKSHVATVNVVNASPVADFQITTPEIDRSEGSQLSFDASGSSDLEGDALQWVWNFGDGTLARGPVMTHTYADDGVYPVVLTVVDEFGGISKASQSVTVENVPPTLTVSSPTTISESALFDLELSSFDPGDDHVMYRIDWGDGATNDYLSDGVKTHQYAAGIQGPVRVTLVDEDGVYLDQYVTTVTVEDSAPIIDGLPTFASAEPNQPITWDVSVTDGIGDTFSLTWDFGDGTIIADSTLTSVQHAYTSEGTYELTLTAIDSDLLSTQQTATVVVGAPVSFTSAGQVINEDAGTVTLNAKLTNGLALDHDVVITLAVEGDVSDADYELTSAQIVIPQGQLSGSTSVDILDDACDENPEDLQLFMVSTSGASQGAIREHVLRIQDNDEKPTVYFTTPSSTVSEEQPSVALKATLSRVSGRDVVVPVDLTGTATLGTDYTVPDPVSILIPAGKSSGTLDLQIVDDDTIETAETIIASLLPSQQADLADSLAQPIAVSTIIAPNDAPDVTLDSAYRVTTESTSTFFITARLSRFSDELITVPIDLSGTAKNGIDYRIVNAALEFLPGYSEASIQININDDSIAEGVETFIVDLLPAMNANLGATQLTVTDILDNDIVRVSFEPGDVSEFEGHKASVKVVLSNPSASYVTIPIVVSGSGVEGVDYSISTHTIVIKPGDLKATIEVSMLDDPYNEPAETVYLAISNSITGAYPGDILSKKIVIKDTDPLVTVVRKVPLPYLEDSGSVGFGVELSAPTDVPIAVSLNYAGLADRQLDYTAPSTVLIPAKTTFAPFDVSLIDDSEEEWTESVVIAIGSVSEGIIDKPRSVWFNIEDDDRVFLSWEELNHTCDEADGPQTLRINLTRPAPKDIIVDLEYYSLGRVVTYRDQTLDDIRQLDLKLPQSVIVDKAAVGEDYEVETSYVTIPQGASDVTFEVPLIDDDVPEETEIVRVRMTEATNAWLPTDLSQRYTNLIITDRDGLQADDEEGEDINPFWSEKIGMPVAKMIEDNDDGIENAYIVAKEGDIDLSFGKVSAGTVFFDTDFDRSRSPLEPTAVTTSDGRALVSTWELADANGNGVLDLDEGQWVGAGGLDTSVNQQTQIAIAAPATYTHITPTSNLIATMLEQGAFASTAQGLQAAEQRFLTAVDLPPNELANLDMIEAAAAGDALAAALFAKDTQLYNTVIAIATTFDTMQAGLPLEHLARLVFDDLADKISAPNSSLDLTNALVVQSVLEGVAIRSGVVIEEAIAGAVAEILARCHEAVDQITPEGSETYLNSVVQSHTFVQSELVAEITNLVLGDMTIAEFLDANSNVEARISGSATFDILPVYLVVGDASMAEGNDGAPSTLTFTVLPIGTSSFPVSVDFYTEGRTATPGSDYHDVSGSLTWAPGDDTSRTISVEIVGDNEFEPNEAFALRLSSPENATIWTYQTHGHIQNDDVFEFTSVPETIDHLIVSINHSSLTIEDNGEILLDARANQGVPVELGGQTEDQLTFFNTSALQTTKTIDLAGTQLLEAEGHSVQVTGIDNIVSDFTADMMGIRPQLLADIPLLLSVDVPASFNEEEATFVWRLYSADSGTPVELGAAQSLEFVPSIGDQMVEITVSDGIRSTTTRQEIEVFHAEIAFSQATFEATEDSGEFFVQLHRTPLGTAVTSEVKVTITGGTATAGSDYEAVGFPLLVTFDPGVNVVSVPIPINADNVVELDETIMFAVTAVNNALSMDQDSATLTILNDDSAEFTISSVSGNEDDGSLTFTVSLSNPVDVATSVDVSTGDGSSMVSDGDYIAIEDLSLSFDVGVTSQIFTVTVIPDSRVELDEAFSVSVSGVENVGRNVAASSEAGTGTILNDDKASVSISDVTVIEGDGGAVDAVFTVTLDSEVDAEVVVDFASADGTASTADDDYEAIGGSVLFAANSPAGSTQIVTVQIHGDIKVEPHERFTVDLNDVNSQGRAVFLSGIPGWGTIENDDFLAGRVFDDLDNDGVFEELDGDAGIEGVLMQLVNEASGATVEALTDADGRYRFDETLEAGIYKIVEITDRLIELGLLDGKETIGVNGGFVDNSQDGNEITGIVVTGNGTADQDAVDYLFAEIRPADIYGMVWRDFNDDGEINFGEVGIENAVVSLTGTDDRGSAVCQAAATAADGSYAFANLRPGSYSIEGVQPSGFDDGRESLGKVTDLDLASAVAEPGTIDGNDKFSGLGLVPGAVADHYNFGERPQAGDPIGEGATAGIGFWHNKNGQALIKSLNGGPDATQLGDWLAATFPAMYGVGAFYDAAKGSDQDMNLAGKTNAEVAEVFVYLFQRKSKDSVITGAPKVDAQVMAVALATYVTSETLAGGAYAADYCFNTSADGIAYNTFNVLEVLTEQEADDLGLTPLMDSQGNAAIIDLLLATDQITTSGLLCDSDADSSISAFELRLRKLVNNLFARINEGSHC